MTTQATKTDSAYQRRVEGADWAAITDGLDNLGCAITPPLLTAADATKLIGLYDHGEAFRSTITMSRHRFGEGEYRYLAAPLPDAVAELRFALYPRLLPIARDWYTKLGRPTPWPDHLDDWLDMCHRAGQTKPSPLILRYGPGDWNALHRDLYGELVFPLQVVINLTEPGVDHIGGEFLLVEQRPRAQSRGTATTLPYLQGLVFTTRDRPVRSPRGWSAAHRHGVSVLHSGRRYTLGILFHDAPMTADEEKRYTLIGADGKPYADAQKGTVGGHRRSKIFGRLDCPTALRAVANGGYVGHRVFFADVATATRAGFRPSAVCMTDAYRSGQKP